MSELEALLRRAENLERVMAGEKTQVDDGLDEFTRVKKACAKNVADIRKLLTERDELLGKYGNSKQTVEMSAKVRKELRALKDNSARLKAMQEAMTEAAMKKGKVTPGTVDQRLEVVELVFRHMAECEQAEKKRFVGRSAAAAAASASAIGNTAEGLKSGGGGGSTPKGPHEVADLQDLDDPELDAGLAMLAEKDKELDADLDMIASGVGRLKNIALDMQTEIRTQDALIDEITEKVDSATAQLQDLNKKLKALLDDAGGPTRIMIYVFMIVLSLALAVFIWTNLGI